VRKICLAAIFLIFVSLNANAESAPKGVHGFTYGVSFNLLSGACEELVYRNNNAKNYVSQLSWQLSPLFAVGFNLHYDWLRQSASGLEGLFSGIFTDVSFKYGIPGKTGMMEDRDWMMSQADWLTHLSLHDNETATVLLGDLDAGFSLKLYNDFRLKAFLSYRFMYYSFIASRGAFLYPEDDGGHAYLVTNDRVGTYRQIWHIISPGLSFYGVFNKYFDAELSIRVSPLIMLYSLDEHLLKDLVITDEAFWGLFVEPALLFSFKPKSSFALVFSLNYRNISGTRGNSTYRYPDESNTYSGVGGAAYSVFDIGISARMKPL
jgi:outer membrane protease